MPGAYTHTSVALHDAVKAYPVPVIEVHLSNPYAREASAGEPVGQVARGTIAGLGALGYVLALDAAARLCRERRARPRARFEGD